jgi:hypothetical protein
MAIAACPSALRIEGPALGPPPGILRPARTESRPRCPAWSPAGVPTLSPDRSQLPGSSLLPLHPVPTSFTIYISNIPTRLHSLTTMKSQKEAEAEVRSWGFSHVYTWTDGAHARRSNPPLQSYSSKLKLISISLRLSTPLPRRPHNPRHSPGTIHHRISGGWGCHAEDYVRSRRPHRRRRRPRA